MKIILTLGLLCQTILVSGQIPEMLVRDSTLLEAIDIFLDSIAEDKIELQKFDITVTIRNLEVNPRPLEGRPSLEYPYSDYEYSYELMLGTDNSSAITPFFIPSCKFRYQGRDIVLYFGAEFFVRYSDKDLKRLNKAGRGRIIRPFRKKGNMLCRVRMNSIYDVWFFR